MSRVVIGIAVSLVIIWAMLIAAMILLRPRGVPAREMLAIVPDTMRLLRRLAGDRAIGPGMRLGLSLTLVYLALPIDLVPDFVPVLGHLDDVIILALVLRWVLRSAGPDAIHRHWPGSPEGLSSLRAIARLGASR